MTLPHRARAGEEHEEQTIAFTALAGLFSQAPGGQIEPRGNQLALLSRQEDEGIEPGDFYAA